MIHNTKVSIIAALSENRAIGKDLKLIWHIPEDLKRFKKITEGHPIIMGRKTYESIGKPLPGRTNIIVTRYTDYVVPMCLIYHSLDEAIDAAKEIDKQEIFIIGGGDIFEQSLPLVDKLYLTIIKGNYEGDTFFPEYKHVFTKEVFREEKRDGKYTFTFLDLERG